MIYRRKMVLRKVVFTTLLGSLLVAVSNGESNACFPNPCKNEGTCNQPPGADTFVCTCIFGFSGETCEIPSKCTFKHIVEGEEETDHIDIINLTKVNATALEECKERCHATVGCRAIDFKEGICQIFRIVPLSIPDISPMRSEKGRVFAIRRCFKRKTPAKRKIEPKEEKQEAASGDVDTHTEL